MKSLLLYSVSDVALLRIYFANRLSGAALRLRRTEVELSEQLPQGSQYSAGRKRSRVLTGSKKTSASSFLMSRWRVRACMRACATTNLYLLVSLVDGGDLVLLVERRLVAEEAHQAFVGEAEELDLLVVLAGVRAPLGVEDGVEREGRVALHNVGQLEAGREQGVGEGPAALGTVARSVRLLPTPVLRDALPAEVVLAAKADGVLVDAEADGTEELVLQTASHWQMRMLRSI